MTPKKPDRTKSPPGYTCRLGRGIGHGRYDSTVIAACGFRWNPETRNREDLLRAAWFHYDAVHAKPTDKP
jgi:hypothetical protein